ncbi:MAG: hypothetical protein AAFP28_07370, partial [Pseudomonadota bacterium]
TRHFMTKLASDRLKRSLVFTRPNTSLIDREILSEGDHLRYDNSNWVRCWYDTDHRVDDDTGAVRALRAISSEGELFWLVHHEAKTYPFHADTETGEEAIEMARLYWARRRIARGRMLNHPTLRRDILAGRVRGTVLIEDAARAGLCSMGTRSFMKRMGLKNRRTVPARIVALLSYVEPQVGLVLQAAFDRIAQEEAQGTTYMAPAE